MTQEQFQTIIKSRAKKHTSEAFQYFWASFALQILLYAMLSHVAIKYFGSVTMVMALIGIALYIPFTIVFMKKYKSMAVASGSINTVISKRIELLESFYKFKIRYELILIPLICLIGTFITFKLYVPYKDVMVVLFFITLISCVIAIRKENKKSFDIPLSKLRMILEDLND